MSNDFKIQKPIQKKEMVSKVHILFTLQQSSGKPADRKIVHPICRSGKRTSFFPNKKATILATKKSSLAMLIKKALEDLLIW